MKNNQLLETLEQITTLEEALSASRRTVTEQEDQHKGMKADLEARVQKEVAARQAFENSQNQMHSLEEDHQKQMRELEQMLQQMNVSSSRALQAKDDQLTRQAAQHAQELSSLKETLDVQRQEIQEAAGMAACQEAIALEDKTRDRMEQIQAQFDEWKLGLEQDKKDAIKDLESKLHTATEQANTQGEQLHAQIASLLSQVQSLQVERQLDEEVVEQVNLRQQYEIGVMTAAMDVLENRSTELEGLINLLAGALSSHASGRQDRELAVAKLTQQVKTLKEALTITQIERNRIEDERNKMEQEHDRLVVELSVARSEASEQLKAAQREHKSECSRLLADTDTRLSSEREEHRRQIQDAELLLKGARAETEEERQKKHAQASQVESMQLDLSANFEAQFAHFPHHPDATGQVTATCKRDTNVALLVTISADADGKPSVNLGNDPGCKIDLDVTFHGSMYSWLGNLVSWAFGSIINKAICSAITTELQTLQTTMIDPFLEEVDMSVDLPLPPVLMAPGFEPALDLRITSNPVITTPHPTDASMRGTPRGVRGRVLQPHLSPSSPPDRRWPYPIPRHPT